MSSTPFAALVACLAFAGTALAQQDAGPGTVILPGPADAPPARNPIEPPGRPRIGLVLSGGGARGGAHLGVLMALEELHIPIDVIAGTSIGAAIGGLYASGMSTAELDEFLHSIDWNAAFLNETPRKLRSFRRKRDDDLFLVNERPGLNHGDFTLPQGAIQGQVIDTVMARETLPSAGIHDFDQFPIPFRAVAGDLETGQAVILDGGDLARVLRASMTVPAAIAPIVIDGHLLVDGGIAMNLPVEVAQQMGADIIIAVDISDELSTRSELKSVVDVTSQLSTLLTKRGTDLQLAKLHDDDILIRPEFGDEQGSLDFSRIAETVPIGYAAVMSIREKLASLALNPGDYAQLLVSHSVDQNAPLPTIDYIKINNDSPIADSVIEARLREVEVGKPLDVSALEKSLNRIYGLELYQNVRYRLLENTTEDGAAGGDKTGLELDLIPRSWGPNYLQLGMQYSSASDQDAKFGLAASYLRTAINRLNGEIRATIGIGDEPSFLTDLYQPLGSKALFFVSPSIGVQSTQLNVFDADRLVSEVRIRETTLDVGVGREMMDWGEIRTGFRLGGGQAELHVGDPIFVPYDDFRSGELFAKFSVDTVDNVSFPTEGILSTIEWIGSRGNLLNADADFDQLRVDTSFAKTWGRHTMLATLRYDATISGVSPLYRVFRAGGLFDISGLNSDQLSGQNVARIGAAYYRRIGNLALFPAFAGVSFEVGNAWASRSDISRETSIAGGSLWAGVDTPVGPIYIAWGLSEGGQDAFYLYMGRVF